MQSLISSKGPTLLTACIRQPSCCVQIQSVRWKKPRWLPIAKTKKFKVPVRIRPPPDDKAELEFLERITYTVHRSIWAYEQAKFLREQEKEKSQETHLQHEEEISKLVQENDKINAEISANREKRRAEQWIKLEEHMTLTRLQKEQEEEETLKYTEQEILQQMERLKTTIKLDNLDDAIEKALSTEVDYNFAIDKHGNVYPGRHNNSTVQRRIDPSLIDELQQEGTALETSLEEPPKANTLIPHYDYPDRVPKPQKPKFFELYE